jgi:hypothetical protein
VIGHTPPICLCRCHSIGGQRQNARHYIDEARERRRAAAVMPVTVISATGVEQGTLHADDSISVGPVTIPQPGDKPSGYPNDYDFMQDPGLEILGDGVVIASATDPARGWHVTGEPSIEQLQDWSDNGGMEAVDGCGGVEDDGTCEHGAPSWMLHLNLI